MEKTLSLLWHLIFGFQLGQILNEERLTNEIAFLNKSLKFKAHIGVNEARKGHLFICDCKRRMIKEASDEQFHEKVKDKNDWANSSKFKLLLDWARYVCAHYGLEVDNLSTSFSDGRALCFWSITTTPSTCCGRISSCRPRNTKSVRKILIHHSMTLLAPP